MTVKSVHCTKVAKLLFHNTGIPLLMQFAVSLQSTICKSHDLELF